MKYLIVVTDGAGDRPLDSIGGLTALQKADMRYINELAKTGLTRSEERRVGKECRSRWSPHH